MTGRATALTITALLVGSCALTLALADAEAGRGSVRHGSQVGARKGAEGGAKAGYARTGTERGARRGATAGAAGGAARGARAGAARDPRTGPGRGGYGAGYRAGYRHGRYHGWEDARRDYRRWRAVTSLVRLGVWYTTRPRYATVVIVDGTTYYYAGGVYYVSARGGYVVTRAPYGAVVYAVPAHTTVVYVGSTPYYYANGTYYVQTTAPAREPPPQETTVNVNVTVDSQDEHAGVESVEMTEGEENYEVAAPPLGATVPYLPDEAKEETVGGKTYFVYADTFYQPFVSDGETIYMVVEDPSAA